MHSLLQKGASCPGQSRIGTCTTLTRRRCTAWTATASAPQLLLQQQRQQDRLRTALLATFHLGPMEYPSKDAATRVGKDLLSTGHPGKEFHPGDRGFEFLWHAWQHHHSAHAYAHKGISHFSMRRDDRSAYIPTRCFWVHFLDGDSRDFSYRKVPDSKVHAEVMRQGGWTGPPAPKQAAGLAAANQAAQAYAQETQHLQKKKKHKQQVAQPVPDAYYYKPLRVAIESQIVRFRASEQRKLGDRFKCPMTNEWVTFDQAHVDHSTAFVVLVHQWLQQEGLQLTDVPHGGWLKGHQHMLKSWQDYHRQHAKLQMVSSRGNLQQNYKAKLALAAAKASTSSSEDDIQSESAIGSSSRSNSSSSSNSSSGISRSSRSSSDPSSSGELAIGDYIGHNSGTSTADSSSSSSSTSTRDTALQRPHRRRRRQLPSL